MKNPEKRNKDNVNVSEEEIKNQRYLGMIDGLLARKEKEGLSDEDEKKLKEIEPNMSVGFYNLSDKSKERKDEIFIDLSQEMNPEIKDGPVTENSKEEKEEEKVDRKKMISNFEKEKDSDSKKEIKIKIGKYAIKEYKEMIQKRDGINGKIEENKKKQEDCSDESNEKLIKLKEEEKSLIKESNIINKRKFFLEKEWPLFKEINSSSKEEKSESEINKEREKIGVSLKEGGADYEKIKLDKDYLDDRENEVLVLTDKQLKGVKIEMKESLLEKKKEKKGLSEDEINEERERSGISFEKGGADYEKIKLAKDYLDEGGNEVLVLTDKQLKSVKIEMEKSLQEKEEKEEKSLLEGCLGEAIINKTKYLGGKKDEWERARKDFAKNFNILKIFKRMEDLENIENIALSAQEELNRKGFLSLLEWDYSEIERKRRENDEKLEKKELKYESRKLYDIDSETGEIIDTGKEKDIFIVNEREIDKARKEMRKREKSKEKNNPKKKNLFNILMTIFMSPIFIGKIIIKLANNSVDKFAKK